MALLSVRFEAPTNMPQSGLSVLVYFSRSSSAGAALPLLCFVHRDRLEAEQREKPACTGDGTRVDCPQADDSCRRGPRSSAREGVFGRSPPPPPPMSDARVGDEW